MCGREWEHCRCVHASLCFLLFFEKQRQRARERESLRGWNENAEAMTLEYREEMEFIELQLLYNLSLPLFMWREDESYGLMEAFKL